MNSLGMPSLSRKPDSFFSMVVVSTRPPGASTRSEAITEITGLHTKSLRVPCTVGPRNTTHWPQRPAVPPHVVTRDDRHVTRVTCSQTCHENNITRDCAEGAVFDHVL
eukprot:GHVU01041121.1.p1 GENE.GHVU01041121.1~~GHVU01041121.1.p1  ORF type:complete len:108 (+),score=3.97 GHVU01041121.1:13-336(+)